MTSDAVANGCSNCNLWHIYFSNPKPNLSEIFEKISKPIVEYWKFSDTTWQTSYHANQYYAIDVNKHGGAHLNARKQMKFNTGLQVILDDLDVPSEFLVGQVAVGFKATHRNISLKK